MTCLITVLFNMLKTAPVINWPTLWYRKLLELKLVYNYGFGPLFHFEDSRFHLEGRCQMGGWKVELKM